jgi:hypothetical protein
LGEFAASWTALAALCTDTGAPGGRTYETLSARVGSSACGSAPSTIMIGDGIIGGGNN